MADGGEAKPAAPPVVVAGRYEIIKPIGKGKFAVVYRAKRMEDGELVALKKIAVDSMDDKAREKCLKEVRLLQSVHHPNVVRYLDSMIEGDELIIVFEWAAAGDLKRQIRKAAEKQKPFEERVVWKYFAQICDALEHMHARRILHRDLKPANVFLTLNGTVKVGDLGLGRMMSEHTFEAHSKVGTPLYMSPEVLRGDGYDWKSDVWSLGCVLYELAALKSPFKAEGLNLYSLFQKISKADYAPLPDIYSQTLRDLAVSMLSVDPAQRPEVSAVQEIATRCRRETMSAAAAAREAAHKRNEAEAKDAPDAAALDRAMARQAPQRRPGSAAPERVERARPGTRGGGRGEKQEAKASADWGFAGGEMEPGAMATAPRPGTAGGPADNGLDGDRKSSRGRGDAQEEVAQPEGRQRRQVANSGTASHEVLRMSEAVVERLCALGYSRERKQRGARPLVRPHFALEGAGLRLPRGQQWEDFLGAAYFLLGEAASELGEQAPAQAATELLSRLHRAGFPADLAAQTRPMELAKGFGSAAATALDWLSVQALEKADIRSPDYSELERVEAEEENAGGSDDDEIPEDVGDVHDEFEESNDRGLEREPAAFAESFKEDREMLRGADAAGAHAWAVELERVEPKLRRAVARPDAGTTWRARLQAATAARRARGAVVDKSLEATGRVGTQVSEEAGRVRKAEGFLDQRFSEKSRLFATSSKELGEVREACSAAEEAVSRKTDEAAEAGEAAAELSGRVEARGADLGDARKLHDLRRALSSLKKETTDLEMQLGMLLSQRSRYHLRLRREPALGKNEEEVDDASMLTDSLEI